MKQLEFYLGGEFFRRLAARSTWLETLNKADGSHLNIYKTCVSKAQRSKLKNPALALWFMAQVRKAIKDQVEAWQPFDEHGTHSHIFEYVDFLVEVNYEITEGWGPMEDETRVTFYTWGQYDNDGQAMDLFTTAQLGEFEKQIENLINDLYE